MGDFAGLAGWDFAGKLELLEGEDGTVAPRCDDGWFAALGVHAPGDGPGALWVVDDSGDGDVAPSPDFGVFLVFRPGRWDAVPVQAAADAGGAPSGDGLVEDAPRDRRVCGTDDEDVVEGIAAFLLDLLQLAAVGVLLPGQ